MQKLLVVEVEKNHTPTVSRNLNAHFDTHTHLEHSKVQVQVYRNKHIHMDTNIHVCIHVHAIQALLLEYDHKNCLVNSITHGK